MTRLPFLFLIISFFFAGASLLCTDNGAHAASSLQRGVDPLERGRQVERVRRFFQRTLDDLNLSRQITEEDIDEIEKESDSIPPLDSAQREADLLSLLDTYYSYLDWLKDRIEEFEGDMEQLSADNLPGSEFLDNGLEDMVSMLKELEKVLGGKIERFSSEGQRVADILERRRFLQSRIIDLEKRLERVEKHHDEKERDHPVKGEGAERIKGEISVVQTEIQSLPQVDEDILAHYQVMIERGKGEAEWIALQIDEYEMLRQVASLLPRETSRFGVEMEKAIHRTMRAYENEINLLNRRIDGLEKSRSRITPVGTLRETERSRELGDFYERSQVRYNDLINRLKIRIGAWRAELAEISSSRKQWP